MFLILFVRGFYRANQLKYFEYYIKYIQFFSNVYAAEFVSMLRILNTLLHEKFKQLVNLQFYKCDREGRVHPILVLPGAYFVLKITTFQVGIECKRQ